jgi:glutamate racemase
MGRDVVLVSSADETAFEVRALLVESGRAARGGDAGHEFLTSGDVETFRGLGERFLGPEVASVRRWDWDAASEGVM